MKKVNRFSTRTRPSLTNLASGATQTGAVSSPTAQPHKLWNLDRRSRRSLLKGSLDSSAAKTYWC